VTTVLLALPEPLASAVAAELAARGVAAYPVPDDAQKLPPLEGADLLVLTASRRTLVAPLVAAADRAGTRIVPVGEDAAAHRLAATFGLGEPLSPDVSAGRLAERILRWTPNAAPVSETRPTTIVVWGPPGAPGRTTLAIELAVELGRPGGHVALVDADAHAPAIALALGLPDEGPGLPAACRQTGLGGLDAAELTCISVPLGMPGRDVDVLVGINRPARWPELSARRVTGALAACREWAPVTVVDVAASLERDEEIVSDLVDGPRRNAATLAALGAADRVVAVLSSDPVGVARFVRAHAELRAVAGSAEITVVVNRLRPGAVGVDPRGQIRRALERYAGVTDVWFVPEDARGADAGRLAARPVAEAAPRSPLVAAVRRLAAEIVPPVAPAAAPVRQRGKRPVPAR
jgi:MinD-like ATPase involved in chromosome partitioning or flagellar assembly